ncbi:MAG: VOC family protein [Rhodospirillales bacterium]|nr:VOC family protein [Rhodospirillales bacterium]
MPGETSLFERAIPVLASLDMAASLDFFHKLGFETHDVGDHNYGIAIREHIEIHFWLCTDRHVAENTSCYVRVNDIHALHADFAKRIDVGEVVETPWGTDELYVWDPSGNLLKFGQVK